ncbi:MAG: hypothetical protein ACLFQA_00455 [Bacteroidales bacterium]
MKLFIPRSGFLENLMLLLIFLLLSGCAGNGSRNDTTTDLDLDITDEELSEAFRAKQIFYSLPSPLETAMMLRSAGAVYNEELMNPVENASKYLTNKQMAINLGVYTTDISYASIFNQSQVCMKYMDTAKDLAENLGIIDAVDNNTMERLEDNLHNQEVIMDIVSESFMNSSSFLQENNREAVAAMMFVGGWIEGLYLALNLTDGREIEGNNLVERIVDSKLSFEVVLLMLEDYKHDQDIADLIVEMDRIKEIFREIDIKSSRVRVINAPDDPVTLLRSDSSSNIDSDIFRQLKSTVTDIRNRFVS